MRSGGAFWKTGGKLTFLEQISDCIFLLGRNVPINYHILFNSSSQFFHITNMFKYSCIYAFVQCVCKHLHGVKMFHVCPCLPHLSNLWSRKKLWSHFNKIMQGYTNNLLLIILLPETCLENVYTLIQYISSSLNERKQ